jgi:hypothetical protein
MDHHRAGSEVAEALAAPGDEHRDGREERQRHHVDDAHEVAHQDMRETGRLAVGPHMSERFGRRPSSISGRRAMSSIHRSTRRG